MDGEDVVMIDLSSHEEDDKEEDEDEKEEEDDGESGSQWNRAEIDGLFCPICMEPWTSDGDHHLCCLPCGHLFGLSCITRWLKQKRGSAKCPQCNRKSGLKDIRKLFASTINVVDEASQKRIHLLEKKCASLEGLENVWLEKESLWKKREVEFQQRVHQLSERNSYLEKKLGDLQLRNSQISMSDQHAHREHTIENSVYSSSCSQASTSSFTLQAELQVDGARLLDIDASGQMLLLARRLPGMGGSHFLTKISLVAPQEREDIYLPFGTKFVKDMRISPHVGSFVLCATLGKKILVLSAESKNVILSYQLPVPAWSCSWDLNSSSYFYAGLQNGLLLVFDVRQTSGPVQSYFGHSSNPIHTIHSLQDNSSSPSGARPVLSASSAGLCHWNTGGHEERYMLEDTTNQGVCISLAYCASRDDIVSSYRPRIQLSNDTTSSQPTLTSPAVSRGIQGSHLHMKRVESDQYEKLGSACATVSDIRLPKSVIIDRKNQTPLLATGDEATWELQLKELPSLNVAQCLKPHQSFICDVKYASAFGYGFLGSLSEDRLQVYKTKLT